MMTKENLETNAITENAVVVFDQTAKKRISDRSNRDIMTSLDAYIIITEAQQDPVTKNRYVREMIDFLEQEGRRTDYIRAIKYFQGARMKEDMKKVIGNMTEKFPILGRIVKFYYPM